MVTKLHSKQRWPPQSPVLGPPKSTVKFADVSSPSISPLVVKKTRSVLSSTSCQRLQLRRQVYSRQASLDSRLQGSDYAESSSPSAFEDIVLGSWVKPKNHRRILDYDLYGYHCWVIVFSYVSHFLVFV